MKLVVSTILILMTWWVSVANAASPLMFEQGTHYEVIREQATKSPQLTEHFSLYCSHCFLNEGLFKKLKSELGKEVAFNRSHVMFLPQQKPQWAKNMTFAFAVAKKLNIEEQFVASVFDYHFKQRIMLGEIDDISDIFSVNGISKAQFKQQLSSQETLEAVKTMLKSASADQVRFTPDLIVNNKYRVLLSSIRGHKAPEQELIKLVRFLLTNP